MGYFQYNRHLLHTKRYKSIVISMVKTWRVLFVNAINSDIYSWDLPRHVHSVELSSLASHPLIRIKFHSESQEDGSSMEGDVSDSRKETIRIRTIIRTM